MRPNATFGVILLVAVLPVLASAGPELATPATNKAANTSPSRETLGIAPFSMHYAVWHGSLKLGTATFTLKPAAAHGWLFAWQARPSGLLALFDHSTYRESTKFTVANGTLRPLAYSYIDTGHKDRDETIDFVWENSKATDVNDGKRRSIALSPGTLDRLLSQLELSRQMANGDSSPGPYTVIQGGKLRAYTFTVLRRQLIKTPAGTFDAVVVKRQETHSNKSFIFWLVPKLAWQPAKIEQHEPGATTDTSVLTKIEWLRLQASSPSSDSD